MKYLIFLFLFMSISSCEKLEPEDVARKYLTALLKLEYQEAKKYASAEAKPAVDHRQKQIEKAPEKYLLDVNKPIILEFKDEEEGCYTFTIFYTRLNEGGMRGTDEKVCVEKIRGRWQVVLGR